MMKIILDVMKIIMTLIGTLIGIAMLIIGISALLALPVMWLWNYVVPYQFGLKEIDFLHAWGLNVLCGFIFKSSAYKDNSKKD